MKFACQKQNLLNAVQIVQRAVANKTTIPVLTGIHITNISSDQLQLQSTDYEIGIICTIPAIIEEPGSMLLAARIFSEVVRKLPQEQIELYNLPGESTVKIVSGSADYSLLAYDANEFPQLKRFTPDGISTISEACLKDMIKNTVFACGQDEARPVFTGALFDIDDQRLSMVATNTHRLAIKKGQLNQQQQHRGRYIVPSRVLHELNRILNDTSDSDVTISIMKNKISFEIRDIYIVSKLIEGQFPNYQQVIPQQCLIKVTLETAIFTSAIDRASILTREGDYNIVKINVGSDRITVQSNNPEIGRVQEEVPATIDGETIEIAFNARYISDVLKVIDQDQILFELTTPLTAACIRPLNDEQYIYVITPVRVN